MIKFIVIEFEADETAIAFSSYVKSLPNWRINCLIENNVEICMSGKHISELALLVSQFFEDMSP